MSCQSMPLSPQVGERFLDVIVSDESTDRYGDVIIASGWQLANYQRNPVALWLHERPRPSAQWKACRVDGQRC